MDTRPKLLPPPAPAWDPSLYQDKHAFVFHRGAGVLEMLEAKAGERVLDLGCGTGQLTGEIARAGASVVGIDQSAEMIAHARTNFPAIRFDVADGTTFRADEPFDAVFSNAALHWIKPPEEAAARVWEALRPGGRFVAEFGGKGNVADVLSCARAAAAAVGAFGDGIVTNYFPSVGEYASLLERQGFEVTFANLFDRPTPLDGPDGLRDWVRMFRGGLLDAIPASLRETFFERMESLARPSLFKDGAWRADYRRLRIVARRR